MLQFPSDTFLFATRVVGINRQLRLSMLFKGETFSVYYWRPDKEGARKVLAYKEREREKILTTKLADNLSTQYNYIP